MNVNAAAYDGDIVSRLRNWRGLHLAHSGNLFEEAADAIVRLRLTNAEREAIARSAAAWETDARMGLSDGGVAVTLRGLLERTR